MSVGLGDGWSGNAVVVGVARTAVAGAELTDGLVGFVAVGLADGDGPAVQADKTSATSGKMCSAVRRWARPVRIVAG